MDSAMKLFTSPIGWSPLFAVVLYYIWRQGGWRDILLFAVVLTACCGCADIVAGIGKHNGLIGSWFQPFEPRLRPMWEPALEGQVHIVREGGLYGTVSGHAANFLSIAIVAAYFVRRRWVTILLSLMVAVVCYTRIYMGYHYPMDILLGLLTGLVVSLSLIALFKHFRLTPCSRE